MSADGGTRPAPRQPLTACLSLVSVKKIINNQSQNEIEKSGLSQPDNYDPGDSLGEAEDYSAQLWSRHSYESFRDYGLQDMWACLHNSDLQHRGRLCKIETEWAPKEANADPPTPSSGGGAQTGGENFIITFFLS